MLIDHTSWMQKVYGASPPVVRKGRLLVKTTIACFPAGQLMLTVSVLRDVSVATKRANTTSFVSYRRAHLPATSTAQEQRNVLDALQIMTETDFGLYLTIVSASAMKNPKKEK